MVFEITSGIIPNFEQDTDTPVFKFIGILKLRRTIFMLYFGPWRFNASAFLTIFHPVKESLVSKVNTE